MSGHGNWQLSRQKRKKGAVTTRLKKQKGRTLIWEGQWVFCCILEGKQIWEHLDEVDQVTQNLLSITVRFWILFQWPIIPSLMVMIIGLSPLLPHSLHPSSIIQCLFLKKKVYKVITTYGLNNVTRIECVDANKKCYLRKVLSDHYMSLYLLIITTGFIPTMRMGKMLEHSIEGRKR